VLGGVGLGRVEAVRDRGSSSLGTEASARRERRAAVRAAPAERRAAVLAELRRRATILLAARTLHGASRDRR
jgi:hypothetical protein